VRLSIVQPKKQKTPVGVGAEGASAEEIAEGDSSPTADDGPEMFPGHRVALVEGRSLTWYGPSLITARMLLAAQLLAAR